MKRLIWHGCYDLGWKGFITPASFAHPAKMSRGLLERIIAHGFEKGYWRENSIIGDCFGGVGTTGIIGAYHGLRVVSVELETRFVSLARRNYALHSSKWKALGSPRPVILQGDSRAFHVLVGKAEPVLDSPPYMTREDGSGIAASGKTTGSDLGRSSLACNAIVASPPYAETAVEKSSKGVDLRKNFQTYKASGGGCDFEGYKAIQEKHSQGYGKSNGQIAALKEGSIDSVVASPPYAGSVHDGNGIDWDKAAVAGKDGGSHKWGPNSQAGNEGYGQSPGQIGALKSGSVDGVVSSPPFLHARSDTTKSGRCTKGGPCQEREQSIAAGREGYGSSPGQIDSLRAGEVSAVVTSPPFERSMSDNPSSQILAGSGGRMGTSCKGDNYGDTPGQIGREQSESYWEAMSLVYRSCFQAIKPGGVLVLVVKDYVKAGNRVPLCDDTVRLIEHIGFQMVERVHAMLVKETHHADLFGADTKQTTSRKSFFRRLAEKKGSPAIDYEEVLFARKPL